MVSGYVKLTEKMLLLLCLHECGFEIYTSNLIEIYLCAKMFALKLTLVLNVTFFT